MVYSEHRSRRYLCSCSQGESICTYSSVRVYMYTYYYTIHSYVHVRYYIETDVDIVTWMYMVYTYMILYMLGVLLLTHIASLLVVYSVIMMCLSGVSDYGTSTSVLTYLRHMDMVGTDAGD